VIKNSIYGNKLSIVLLGLLNDDILTEDLTGIVTKPDVVKHYYGELRSLCRLHNTTSLTANQVGIRENFFFVSDKVRLLPAPGCTIVINPTWEPSRGSKQYVSKGEDCPAIPNLNGIGNRHFDVRRWSKITASWTDVCGNRVKPRNLSGIAAQLFQQAHDSLRGILLTMSGTEIKTL
jgi:peptide deformylase